MTRRSVYITALAAFIAVTTMTITSILLPRWITYSVTSHSHRHDSPVHVASGFHDYIGLHQRCQTPVHVQMCFNCSSTVPTSHRKHDDKQLKCAPFPNPRFCSGFHSGPSLGPPPSPSPGPPPPPNNPNPFPNPDPPKPGPDIPTGQEKRRFFCNTWKTTAFLMNLSVVLEVATLVGFVVLLVLGGGGQGGRGRRDGRDWQDSGRGGQGERRRGRNSRNSRNPRMEGKEGWKVLAWMMGAVGVGMGLAGGLVAYLFHHDDLFNQIPGYRLGASWYLCMFGALISMACMAGLIASAFVLPFEEAFVVPFEDECDEALGDEDDGQRERERLPLLE